MMNLILFSVVILVTHQAFVFASGIESNVAIRQVGSGKFTYFLSYSNK